MQRVMSIAVGKKIKLLRQRLGETQEVFGERLGVEQATVSRWEKGEAPRRRYEQPIAELAGMTVAEFFHSPQPPQMIPLVGELAGGAVSLRATPTPGGAVGHISLKLGENDQIALSVHSNAWAPAYRNGDTLIATRLPKSKTAKAVGRDCIVKTAKGEAFVKLVKKGSRKGLYALRDPRPTEDDMDDVELEWAAPIIWIGRAQ